MDLLNTQTEPQKILRFPISEADFEKNKSKPLYDGPISGPMWKKINALGSSYPDTFDWSTYDRIYERFGENQPRGGVVYKKTLKLVNFHSSCSKCHYALEIDTYGRGCIHNCKYCYAKEQLFRRGFWNNPFPMPVDLSEVRKIFYEVFETQKKNKWRNILEKRVPLRIGSMSDSFMWMDQKHGVTKELLKILSYYSYPYIIFTRSDLVAHDDYLALLEKDICAVQFSICGNNDELTRTIEPGAPSNKRRLAALKKLAEAGIWTTVRLNPLFPTYPDGYFTDKDSIAQRFGSLEAVPKLNFFPIEQVDDWMNELKEAKVPSVLAGFVRLTQNAIAYVGRDAKIDFKKFFRPELITAHGERVYSNSEISHYYKLIHASAKNHGIRFSTCFIGNGLKDYFRYQHLWSNQKGDCCDARSNVQGFLASSQDIPWKTRAEHSGDLKQVEKNKMEEDHLSSVYPDLANPRIIASPKKALKNEVPVDSWN